MRPAVPSPCRSLLLGVLAGALVAVLLLALAGCGSSGPSQAQVEKETKATTAAYREYLLEEASKLITWSSQLRHKIKIGIYTGAESRYASGRVPFGHIQPIAGSLPGYERRVDADRTGYYHEIENDLWKNQVSSATLAAASHLFASSKWLHEALKTTNLSPATILAGARRTLAKIAQSELQLKEEPNAELDILDASANLEGVEAAYKALRPTIVAQDPELPHQTYHAFAEAFKAIEPLGTAARELDQPRASSPGTSFIHSSELDPEEISALKTSVLNLTHAFSQVSPPTE